MAVLEDHTAPPEGAKLQHQHRMQRASTMLQQGRIRNTEKSSDTERQHGRFAIRVQPEWPFQPQVVISYNYALLKPTCTGVTAIPTL